MQKKKRSQTARWQVASGLLTGICLLLVLLLALFPERKASPPATQPAMPPEAPPATQPTVPERIAAPNRPSVLPAAGRTERPVRLVKVAIVLDDVGYSLADLQPFLAFPGPLTFSVLPDLPHTREAAELVKKAGKELLLHCPMEAQGGEDPGARALKTEQSPEQIEMLLEDFFAQVPGAEGLNNHMGSKLTADRRSMEAVLAYLKRKGRLFLDSRTTAESLGRGMAEEMEVPALSRDVFLDNAADRESIEKALAVGLRLARRNGRAVLIGHVRNHEILKVLEEAWPRPDNEEMRLVSLRALLEP